MSNELPWKRWTPDDLAPPLSEFTPAAIPTEALDPDVEQPELSEEEQQAQMLAQLQMQAHEQGYNAGLNEGRQKGHELGYQEGLAKGLEHGIDQARQQQAPIHARMQQLVSEFQHTLDALDSGKPQLRVHPDDLQRVEESLGATLNLHGWRLRGDPSLHHGGCKVSADEGDLDASVATRWQELCRLAAPGVV